MSAAPENDLNAGLMARFGLSEDKLLAIHHLMQSSAYSFVEAAQRLGYLTHEQVAEALNPLNAGPREPAQESVGLFESAIRRVASNRQVVLAQGEFVKPGPQLILAHDADNPRSEKIRALRTEILLLSEASTGANIIALLSAQAREGRSQLAAELAISFSQLGRRTLLIDADMRQPKQHLLFGSSNDSGLADALLYSQKPRLHPVEGLAQLSLLTSGRIPPNPLDLLSDGRFAKLLEDFRRSYEFVILDTPPISAFADGLAVATLAGKGLVLSRGQHSTFQETRELMRRLTATQSQILGAVINYF
jgi:receptor protein-tyrosine kinase